MAMLGKSFSATHVGIVLCLCLSSVMLIQLITPMIPAYYYSNRHIRFDPPTMKLDLARYNEKKACMTSSWESLRRKVAATCGSKAITRDILWTCSMYDIGRESWPGFQRPYRVYLDRMKTNFFNVLNHSDVGIVLFADEIATKDIQTYISQLHRPESLCVVTIKEEEIPYYGCLHKEMNDSMEVIRDHLRTHSGTKFIVNPEWNYPKYNEHMYFKMMILHEMALVNPFNSTRGIYIDAGYHHINTANTKLNPQTCGNKLCIGINLMSQLQEQADVFIRDPYVIATDGNRVMDGATQSGSIESAQRYGQVIDPMILKFLLGYKFSNDDQVVWISALLQHPEYFHGLDCHGWSNCGKAIIYNQN